MKFKVLNLRKSFTQITAKAMLGVMLLATSVSAMAVSEQEMDQARAIAAQKYLRYKNNNSAYLDKFTPTSMQDLKDKLQDKEKENIKSFESIGNPSDYGSWDKAQLVSYWTDTFFANNKKSLGLESGYDWIKNNAKTSINKNVSGSGTTTGASTAAATPAPTTGDNAPASDAVEIAQEVDAIQAAQNVVAQQEADNKKEEKKSSGTWVYIMILGILVVVVVFLVMYASRTMKTQPKVLQKIFQRQERQERKEKSSDYAPKPVRTPGEEHRPRGEMKPKAAPGSKNIAEETKMREKYAESLASKSEEIRSLTRQLSEAEATIARLREENNRLKNEAHKPRTENRHHTSETTLPPASDTERTRPVETEKKEVFLGRVNSKGLFVRADRQAVEGQSIYKLSTSNGVSGTYTVINNPVLADMMLEEPGKWLAGGCFAKDIFDTEGKIGIVTENPGTAVFRDGAWRVEKKAKIRYE